MDLESGTATEIARSADDEACDLTFSPDSALLAWSEGWMAETAAQHIRLIRLADGLITDVTPQRFDDKFS